MSYREILSEGFADSFKGYFNARERGPEALSLFRQAYPDTTAYFDELWAS